MLCEEKIFKVISESTRLRIIRLLLETKKEICGCEFVDSLRILQYNLTKHTDILMDAGLMMSHKESKWVYYSVCPPTSKFCESLHEMILRIKGKIYQDDKRRFEQRLRIRKNGKCCLGIQNQKLI